MSIGKFRVGIIGAGAIGNQRAKVIQASKESEVVAILDIDELKARALAQLVGCQYVTNPQEIYRFAPDIVIVATPTKYHAPVSIAAMEHGCHVLCEKPLSRTVPEAEAMVDAAIRNHVVLKTGFNHRHLQNVQQAWRWVQEGKIGRLMYIRSRYGHGGRLGYEKEWQGDPELAGGGELLSQGVHTLDLAHWFLGGFSSAIGMLQTAFYDVKPLEDNAFALLRTDSGQIASIHVSWTQWRNLFSFEIFGTEGFIDVEGRGGSYGLERVRLAKRPPQHGFPVVESIEFPDTNGSWAAEWQEFIEAIREKREPLGSGYDGLQVMRLAWAVYESVEQGQTMKIGDSA